MKRVVALLAVSVSASAAPRLVADLQTTQAFEWNDGDPHCFFDAGGYVLFQASSREEGSELWRTDGTEEGTWLVKDLAPGALWSSPCGFARLRGEIFFSAADGATGRTLWRTDGTARGTLPVTRAATVVGGLTQFGGELYFTGAGAPGLLQELWKTDGTDSGTRRVTSLGPTTYAGWPVPLVPFGGRLWFATASGVWSTDGTEAPTVLESAVVKPDELTVAGASLYFTAEGRLWRASGGMVTQVIDLATPHSLAALGDELYFAADDGVTGVELWRTDGARTRQVADLNPTGDSSPFGLGAIGGDLYFSAKDELGRHPFRYRPGNVPVRLWEPGVQPVDANVHSFVALGDVVLFYGGYTSLWRTDGTPEGTHRLPASLWSPIFVFGDRAFFASMGGSGSELFVTDGTDAGTGQLVDIWPSVPSANPMQLVPTRGGLFFGANYGETYSTTGVGATLLPAKLAWNQTRPVAQLGDTVLFSGLTVPDELELWRSDGTTDGTRLVRNISPLKTSTPNWLTTAGDQVFFSANDGTHGRELWRSDGTLDGTRMVADLQVPVYQDDFFTGPGFLTAVGSSAFFIAWDDVNGVEPYATDGDSAAIVADVAPGQASCRSIAGADYANMRPLGTDRLFYFTANDGVHGTQLWRTDGTPEGLVSLTQLDFEILIGKLGDVAFFNGRDAEHGQELWRTDGTPEGTYAMPEIRPGPFGSTPLGWIDLGDFALFAADDGEHGYELWRTDGTVDGTRMVADLAPGPDHGMPTGFTRAGDQVVFAATDGESGVELWVTDGVTARRVADVAPGSRPSNPGSLTVWGDQIFFAANDGTTGRELWVLPISELDDAPTPTTTPPPREPPLPPQVEPDPFAGLPDGCGCRIGPRSSEPAPLWLLLVLLVPLRRRGGSRRS